MINLKSSIGVVVIFIFTINSFSQPISELRKLFSYDKGLETLCKVVHTKDTVDCTISELCYQGVGDIKLNALLIVPHKMIRQYPIVLFYAGNNPDKLLLLGQGINLSHQSIATLLIDIPQFVSGSFDAEKDFQAYQQTIIHLRRSIDMLEKQSQIDPMRIAFFGYDIGAWAGAVLSGVENRISTYILITGSSFPNSDFNSDKQQVSITSEQMVIYNGRMKPLFPSKYLENHFRNTILFQFPVSEFINETNYFQKIYLDTKEPKQQKIYKANFLELLLFPEAVNDRINWLKNRL